MEPGREVHPQPLHDGVISPPPAPPAFRVDYEPLRLHVSALYNLRPIRIPSTRLRSCPAVTIGTGLGSNLRAVRMACRNAWSTRRRVRTAAASPTSQCGSDACSPRPTGALLHGP